MTSFTNKRPRGQFIWVLDVNTHEPYLGYDVNTKFDLFIITKYSKYVIALGAPHLDTITTTNTTQSLISYQHTTQSLISYQHHHYTFTVWQLQTMDLKNPA